MDDSWRIPMGSVVLRRRSTEEERRRPRGAATGGELGPADFRDVFGGPPRTVLLRRFSGEYPRMGETMYDEIFGAGERGIATAAAVGGGRRLPGFRIPASAVVKTEEGFYDDIFGSDCGEFRSKSRSKSKSDSTSPSVLSSEEASPPVRQKTADDSGFSSFASKLRPIVIPTRGQNSSPPSTFFTGGESDSRCTTNRPPADQFWQRPINAGFSYCSSPPDTISLQPSLCRAQKMRAPGGSIASDTGSPSSVISSVLLNTMAANSNMAYIHRPNFPPREVDKEVMEIEARAESSFFIEMDSYSHSTAKDTEGAAALDEAIAWAKEKFWSQSFNGSQATEDVPPCRKQMDNEESTI